MINFYKLLFAFCSTLNPNNLFYMKIKNKIIKYENNLNNYGYNNELSYKLSYLYNYKYVLDNVKLNNINLKNMQNNIDENLFNDSIYYKNDTGWWYFIYY